MATSPAFVGPPQVSNLALTSSFPTATHTAGVNGGVVRKIWVNCVSNEATLSLQVLIDDTPVGTASLVPNTIANADLLIFNPASDLLLSGLFAGLSLDSDRYFNLGPDEIITFVGVQSDGSALVAGEYISIRVEGADY